MTQKKLALLILTPCMVLVGVYAALVVREINIMSTATPDGKGASAADYIAGRTETCVTLEFVKGGWAYPCTKTQQVVVALGHALVGVPFVPLLILNSIRS